ncbi:hypothetical protein NEISICOT_00789 [Neisseria sicca ATCC 29256]|uniref:Uncharacterized protein n=1 Tax=Neisseria sicca ATCC 29256 TaxID=547045 RepID=C6M2Q0_NEISI|nr:hypothetical protein NEISICOT_00789 [Neisseria sicca ATCC 29256]
MLSARQHPIKQINLVLRMTVFLHAAFTRFCDNPAKPCALAVIKGFRRPFETRLLRFRVK